jgi:glycosyltransferase involved in cell wall biosynthesis
MNIAIVGDSIGLQNAGSLISAWRFAAALVRKGHKVVLITTGKENSFNIIEGVRVYTMAAKKVPFLNSSWRMSIICSKNLIKQIFLDEKIEVAHLVIPTILCYKSLNVSRQLGIPVVSHFHTQPENFLDIIKIKSKIFNKLFYRFSIWFYKKSDILICPSKFAQGKIKQYAPKMKTIVISNGVDLSEFSNKPVTPSFLRKFKIPLKSKKILFVGRLWKEKNVEVLIKAMDLIVEKDKSVVLMIVGKKERNYSLLEKMVSDYSLEKIVIFLGRVTQEELIDAYNSADIFCLPSIAELEGMVVLEAMAHGKPLIISNSEESAARYFVEKNGFLFDPYDENDLSKKILKLISDRNLMKKMGNESLRIVKDYDISSSVTKLVRVYRSLLR